MPIAYYENNRLFSLSTNNSTYQCRVSEYGHLLHVYYGHRTDDDMSYLLQCQDRGFSGNPLSAIKDRTYSLDTLPMEYPVLGNGDYRETCLEQIDINGTNSSDFLYEGYQIYKGKKELEGLPSSGADYNTDTLEISLIDKKTNTRLILSYSVFPDKDVITRNAKIVNNSNQSIVIPRIYSCCLDYNVPTEFDVISFHGKHVGERTAERHGVHHGKFRIDSYRTASSLHYNPSMILCEKNTTERSGNCYGFNFVYSGSFVIQVEKDQVSQTRVVVGINDREFSWKLNTGESFQTPETIISYSANGLTQLTANYHHFIRNNICRGKYATSNRPILINNWEATYFDFNEDKIMAIVDEASKLGIDMFVLDDGWFGERNNDTTSLGDWSVNLKKLPSGLGGLQRKIQQKGMKFGIWVEPEMISPESKLMKEHPEWALRIPGRDATVSRNQMVLDLANDKVVDHLVKVMSSVIEESHASYIKWDMNRNICEKYSPSLSEDRQGEIGHRYILGLYKLYGTLTKKYPDILFESCSGGGGRFDCGMLYYTPQIWCSDNTDAISRLDIQYGTSFMYPLSCISSHISAVPNHQTGRETPIETRATVAMTGAFGYELDLSKVVEEEKKKATLINNFYHANSDIFINGEYYRLTETGDKHHNSWMFVSQDKKKAIFNYVNCEGKANSEEVVIKLNGLDEDTKYSNDCNELLLSGKTLMAAGFVMPVIQKEYESKIIVFTAHKS